MEPATLAACLALCLLAGAGAAALTAPTRPLAAATGAALLVVALAGAAVVSEPNSGLGILGCAVAALAGHIARRYQR